MVVLLVLAIVVGVLGITGFVLANTGTFAVKEVSVSGVSHITAEEMTELAAVPEGTTLLNVDDSGITSRLTSNPWVQSVTVERVFPDKINLKVTERSISAVVSVTVDESNTIERWALSPDGMWLTKLPDQNSEEGKALSTQIYEDAANALEITDIPYGSSPEAGKYCSNANVENALSIIDGMTTELSDQIKSVAAASSNSTTLTLDNGVEIAFGEAKDIRDKERVCLELLKQHEGKISYINVRVVNKPVWRSL
ncbi:MAG: FtsQ-type POTRA domain-containing protein [Eggerthellaceae bacterium]